MLQNIPNIEQFFSNCSHTQDATGNYTRNCQDAFLGSDTKNYLVLKIKNPHLLPDYFQLPGNYKIIYWSHLNDETVIVRTDVSPLLWVFYWITLRLERSVDVAINYVKKRRLTTPNINNISRLIVKCGVINYIKNTDISCALRYIWREWTIR